MENFSGAVKGFFNIFHAALPPVDENRPFLREGFQMAFRPLSIKNCLAPPSIEENGPENSESIFHAPLQVDKGDDTPSAPAVYNIHNNLICLFF